MIALVEGANRQKTPNEIALNILLAALTICSSLPSQPSNRCDLLQASPGSRARHLSDQQERRHWHRVRLDKTGTITLGNRQASEFLPVGDTDEAELADAAQLSSLADETPEGRSVVVLAKTRYGLRARQPGELASATWVPFSAQTRMSGVDLPDRGADGAGLRVRKGAAAAVLAWVRENGGGPTNGVGPIVDGISAAGGTPLVVAEQRQGEPARALGVIHLKDVVRAGMRERF
jgi:K+-transporting ATPase ATPase B chain